MRRFVLIGSGVILVSGLAYPLAPFATDQRFQRPAKDTRHHVRVPRPLSPVDPIR